MLSSSKSIWFWGASLLENNYRWRWTLFPIISKSVILGLVLLRQRQDAMLSAICIPIYSIYLLRASIDRACMHTRAHSSSPHCLATTAINYMLPVAAYKSYNQFSPASTATGVYTTCPKLLGALRELAFFSILFFPSRQNARLAVKYLLPTYYIPTLYLYPRTLLLGGFVRRHIERENSFRQWATFEEPCFGELFLGTYAFPHFPFSAAT